MAEISISARENESETLIINSWRKRLKSLIGEENGSSAIGINNGAGGWRIKLGGHRRRWRVENGINGEMAAWRNGG